MDNHKSFNVGIVTVTYNSGKVIDEFLDSILSQAHQEYILYIIDNASSDDTLIRVAKYQDLRIVVIRNQDNVGVAAGNNQGIKRSLDDKCSHILLINNDTVFSINLIGKLLSELEINECDMIVPKIMYHDEQNRIWAAGGYFNRFAAYSGNIYGSDEIDIGQFDTSREIECSPTCCMLIQSSVFSKVGLMDEKYFVYCDDSDFCYRTMVNGVKLWYASTITLYHKASSLTGGKFSEFTIYYTVRNRIYYIHKNLSPVMYPFWVLFCYLRYSLPTLAGQDTWKIFLLKQKAIFEGLKMSTKNSSK